MDKQMRRRTQHFVRVLAACVVVGGMLLGLLVFSLMAVSGTAFRHYAFVAIGIAGVVGLVVGIVYFLRSPP
jgi:hypothetical protein